MRLPMTAKLNMVSEKKFCPKPRFRIYSPADLGKKWFVFYYDEDGKRQRVYGNINTVASADEKMKLAEALISELEKEKNPKKPVKTDDYQRALDWMNQQGWRPKSFVTHRSIVNAWFEFLAGRPGSKELAREFFAELKGKKKPSTYNNYLNLLSAILKGIGQDYCEGIDTVRQNPTPARYFQQHQIKRLSAEISNRDPQLWHFVEFLYYCFIRPRELCRLKVGNVILENNQIYVPGDVSKNKKSEYVTIPKAFRDKLEYLKHLPPDQWLFPSPKKEGEHLGFDKMYRRHQKILKELNFGQGYVLYSWKHTGAVMAVKAGISLKELQIQLRHHSLDQVDQYLRQMGVWDLQNLQENFPAI
jgi:integrase